MNVMAQLVTGFDLPRGEIVEVFNPARSDEVVGTIPSFGPQHTDAVVQVAHKAQRGWAAMTPTQRFDYIRDGLADLDTVGADVLLTREQGRVLADSTRELQYLTYPVKFLESHLEWLTNGESLDPMGTGSTRIHRDPFGVVLVITPWNIPVGMPMVTIAPALLAGNAVVVHVPPTAPLTALKIFSDLAAQLPPGVLTLVSSPNVAVAQSLVEHPLVRNVHFTGSTAIGAVIAKEAADTMTNLTLELGGNDAAIVLDAAFDPGAFEPDDFYKRLIAGAFPYGGQACTAIKRLYVPAARVAEVVDGLGAVLDRVVVGDGLDPNTTMGALHTAAGRKRVERLVASARAQGGTVHTFGAMAGDPDNGHFLLPVVVTGLGQSADLVAEEQFGPALPIVGYSNIDEAVSMANDSDFGLGASVWSGDIEDAVSVARRLQVGMSWINQHAGPAIDGRVPWGGTKLSGIGRGGSNRAGLEAFTEPHAISVAPR
jgi:acyl-CoA reductase-like NAD-dependent aldehyde dehydrogenase